MPRTCTICRHADRAELDQALIEHRPYRDIARQFGVSNDDAEEVASADGLFRQAGELRSRTIKILDAAETAADWRAACRTHTAAIFFKRAAEMSIAGIADHGRK